MMVFGSTAHLRDVKGEAIHTSYYDEYGAILFLSRTFEGTFVPSYQIVNVYNFFGILDGLVTSSSTRNTPPGCAYIFWNITTKVIRQIMTMRK